MVGRHLPLNNWGSLGYCSAHFASNTAFKALERLWDYWRCIWWNGEPDSKS